MEVKDYLGGIERLDDAIRALALGKGDIQTRLREIRRLYLSHLWPDNMPGDMWFDLKRIHDRIDAPDLDGDESVALADGLIKMRARLVSASETTPQHTWIW